MLGSEPLKEFLQQFGSLEQGNRHQQVTRNLFKFFSGVKIKELELPNELNWEVFVVEFNE